MNLKYTSQDRLIRNIIFSIIAAGYSDTFKNIFRGSKDIISIISRLNSPLFFKVRPETVNNQVEKRKKGSVKNNTEKIVENKSHSGKRYGYLKSRGKKIIISICKIKLALIQAGHGVKPQYKSSFTKVNI